MALVEVQKGRHNGWDLRKQGKGWRRRRATGGEVDEVNGDRPVAKETLFLVVSRSR